mmetsp:Transcript_65489/g.171566  ORF Transcript_65489/g.171566 Transcript_65489/m.171566 type:complete len:230 (-) Transcript_65489:918-1607(-)
MLRAAGRDLDAARRGHAEPLGRGAARLPPRQQGREQQCVAGAEQPHLPLRHHLGLGGADRSIGPHVREGRARPCAAARQACGARPRCERDAEPAREARHAAEAGGRPRDAAEECPMAGGRLEQEADGRGGLGAGVGGSHALPAEGQDGAGPCPVYVGGDLGDEVHRQRALGPGRGSHAARWQDTFCADEQRRDHLAAEVAGVAGPRGSRRGRALAAGGRAAGAHAGCEG